MDWTNVNFTEGNKNSVVMYFSIHLLYTFFTPIYFGIIYPSLINCLIGSGNSYCTPPPGEPPHAAILPCIGDMIGVPVEFTSRVERSIDPVKELRAYGTYHQGFGVWSDDTSLMIALIASLIDGFSLERLSNYFVSYV